MRQQVDLSAENRASKIILRALVTRWHRRRLIRGPATVQNPMQLTAGTRGDTTISSLQRQADRLAHSPFDSQWTGSA